MLCNTVVGVQDARRARPWLRLLDLWKALWPLLCAIGAAILDTGMQLMTLGISNRFLDMFKLIRTSSLAEYMVDEEMIGELFFDITSCGQLNVGGGFLWGAIPDEGWNPGTADKWVSLGMLGLFCFIGFPIFFFYMPMLFGTRDLNRWHLNSLLRPLVRPGEKHKAFYMVPSLNQEERFQYYVFPKIALPLFCRLCHWISCCTPHVRERFLGILGWQLGDKVRSAVGRETRLEQPALRRRHEGPALPAAELEDERMLATVPQPSLASLVAAGSRDASGRRPGQIGRFLHFGPQHRRGTQPTH